jgi:DNA-binding MarR family transcriptional regulator
MSLTKSILETISRHPVNPGEIIVETGLPRYEVLAAVHVLEELGFIEKIYSRGTHKVYVLTEEGKRLLEALSTGDYKLSITATGKEGVAAES